MHVHRQFSTAQHSTANTYLFLCCLSYCFKHTCLTTPPRARKRYRISLSGPGLSGLSGLSDASPPRRPASGSVNQDRPPINKLHCVRCPLRFFSCSPGLPELGLLLVPQVPLKRSCRLQYDSLPPTSSTAFPRSRSTFLEFVLEKFSRVCSLYNSTSSASALIYRGNFCLTDLGKTAAFIPISGTCCRWLIE